MYKSNISLAQTFRWLTGRVAVIYVILFLFFITCVNLKTLDDRIKVRRLNQAVPNFDDMINSSMGKNEKAVDWAPYQHYFELILRYLPDDKLARQLLGYVDCYAGKEDKAIALFKGSVLMNGHLLFWSNYNLGVLYYKKGMWPQALDYLFKAISANSQLNVLLMKNSIIYKQILSGIPTSYSLDDGINNAKGKAYILILSSLQHMGQYDQMIAVSNFAIANQNSFPNDDFYYYAAGLAFYETGQMEKAFLFFQKSLTIEKNNPDTYYYIANIYQKERQVDQARDFLRISYLLHQKNDPRFPYEAQVNPRFF